MTPRQPFRARRAAIVTAMLATFCFAFTQMSVPALLPEIDEEFGASPTWSSWTFSAFMLFAVVSMPMIGRLADQHGRRRLLVISLGVFLVGCIGAAAAPSLPVLIISRGVQGTAAVFVALTVSLLTEILPPGRRGAASGMLIATLGIGNFLGALLCPALADAISWRLAFAMSAGIAIVAVVLVPRLVPEPAGRIPGRFDLAGGSLLAAAMVAVMLALTEGSTWGWGSPATIGLFALAVALFGAWSLVELRVREPMIELRMLAQRSVAVTNAATLLGGFAAFSLLSIVPRLLAAGRDLPASAPLDYGFAASTTTVGLYLVPGTLAGAAAGVALSRLGARVVWKWALITMLAIMVLGATGLAIWHDAPWQVVVAVAVCMIGSTSAATIGVTIVVEAVRAGERAVATAMNAVAFQAGGAIGVQVVAAVLEGSIAPATGLPTNGAFTAAFLTAAIAAAAAIPFVFALRHRRQALPAGDARPESRGPAAVAP